MVKHANTFQFLVADAIFFSEHYLSEKMKWDVKMNGRQVIDWNGPARLSRTPGSRINKDSIDCKNWKVPLLCASGQVKTWEILGWKCASAIKIYLTKEQSSWKIRFASLTSGVILQKRCLEKDGVLSEKVYRVHMTQLKRYSNKKLLATKTRFIQRAVLLNVTFSHFLGSITYYTYKLVGYYVGRKMTFYRFCRKWPERSVYISQLILAASEMLASWASCTIPVSQKRNYKKSRV